jgi:hypothetical protein
MKISELRQKLEQENGDHEVSVGVDVEGKAIVASLSVYRLDEDEVIDVMTEEYHITGFSAERNGEAK